MRDTFIRIKGDLTPQEIPRALTNFNRLIHALKQASINPTGRYGDTRFTYTGETAYLTRFQMEFEGIVKDVKPVGVHSNSITVSNRFICWCRQGKTMDEYIGEGI